jgi:hypothetical protein
MIAKPDYKSICDVCFNKFFLIRHLKRRFNFEDALNGCMALRNRHANIDHYNEDIANLLTLAKLRHFYRNNRNASHHFHKKIRLNAIKYKGSWWAIHNLPRRGFHIIDGDIFNSVIWLEGGVEKILKITQKEFEFIGEGFNSSRGHDRDTLLYNPWKNRIEIEHHWKRHKIVCSHKRESRIG